MTAVPPARRGGLVPLEVARLPRCAVWQGKAVSDGGWRTVVLVQGM